MQSPTLTALVAEMSAELPDLLLSCDLLARRVETWYFVFGHSHSAVPPAGAGARVLLSYPVFTKEP